MTYLSKIPINIDTSSHAQLISYMKTSNSTEKISLLDFILQKYSTNMYTENKHISNAGYNKYSLPNPKHMKLIKLIFEYGCDYYSTKYSYNNLSNYRVMNVYIDHYISKIKNKIPLRIAFDGNNLEALKYLCRNSDNIQNSTVSQLIKSNSQTSDAFKILTNVLKPWSIFNHYLFPNKFRNMVKSILIINNRLWNSNTRYYYFLPDELWHVIFSYSDRLNFYVLKK